jgi:hypothetical protein
MEVRIMQRCRCILDVYGLGTGRAATDNIGGSVTHHPRIGQTDFESVSGFVEEIRRRLSTHTGTGKFRVMETIIKGLELNPIVL